MKKIDVILSSALLFAAATGDASLAFGQGFGDYAAPTTRQAVPAKAPLSGQPSPTPQTRPAAAPPQTAPIRQNAAAPQTTQTPQTLQTPQTRQPIATAQTAQTPQTRQPIATAQTTQTAQTAQTTQTAQTVATAPTTPNAASAYASQKAAQPVRVAQAPAARPAGTPTSPSQPAAATPVANAFVPPPAHYKLSEKDKAKLDEFLNDWENYGKGIKQVSCDVHMMEFDGGVLQQDSKKPVAHTWGLFRFKAPNQLLYHIKGEFSYANVDAGGEATWKEGQNELKIVLDGKSLVQYDYGNKKAVVYPLAEDEQDLDLTMDNGQFPLFFVAKAETLKNRFYLRLVTPAAKRQSEVWIEAFPRYARDAQQFQSIVVILGLKDMQPTYMRKVGVNGKSKTDLKFERVEVNKGRWTIEGTVDADWTKEVRPERFSLLRQEPVETNYAQTPNAPASNAASAVATPTPTPMPSARTATRPNVRNAVR